ncbi:MAG: hypothetical protein ACLUFT_09890 [Gemmiger formicilis]|uniref:hypothetical protein n=1 Tax=Gemmiger formicilis TaxID=745368 RepID=UPI00399476D8
MVEQVVHHLPDHPAQSLLVRGYATAMDGLYHLKPVLGARGVGAGLPGRCRSASTRRTCTAANHGYGCGAATQNRARASMLRTALTGSTAPWRALAQQRANWARPGCRTPAGGKVARCLRTWGWTLECSVTADLARAADRQRNDLPLAPRTRCAA